MFSRLVLSLVPALFCAGVLHAAEVPRKSPEFAITLPDGNQALVSQYRGKVLCVLLVLST